MRSLVDLTKHNLCRKLKPDARPIEEPDNPNRLVSGADCRLMAFETVSEATRLWIKGRDFTIARLLGDTYKHETEKYNGGGLCIFRLAPQDYHRFHSPVDGTIGKMTYISGEYYTVNVCVFFFAFFSFQGFWLVLSGLSSSASSDSVCVGCVW